MNIEDLAPHRRPTYRKPGDTSGFKLKIRLPDGRVKFCGCGTRDRQRYDAMRAWVQSLKRGRHRRIDILEAIVVKGIPLADAFDSRKNPDAILGMSGARNIEPYVATWVAEKRKSRKGAESALKYEGQVRQFIPEGRAFAAARFTAHEVRGFLRGLDVADPTRNRYKAALSSFGEYLVDEGVLERNPVRDVRGFSEGDPKVVYYELDEAARLLAAISGQEEAAAVALAIGACAEWQTIGRLRARDVNLAQRKVFLDGGKTRWRRREARVVFDFCLPYIRKQVQGRLPDAPLFDTLKNGKQLLAAIEEAAKACSLRRLTFHDQRHTHIVNGLRSGYSPTAMAHNAGHSNTNLVWTRYGRYVVDDRDFAPMNRQGQEKTA